MGLKKVYLAECDQEGCANQATASRFNSDTEQDAKKRLTELGWSTDRWGNARCPSHTTSCQDTDHA